MREYGQGIGRGRGLNLAAELTLANVKNELKDASTCLRGFMFLNHTTVLILYLPCVMENSIYYYLTFTLHAVECEHDMYTCFGTF